MYRRNLLDSETKFRTKDNVEDEDTRNYSENMPDLIKKTRQEYGRYFGICGSYHHLKACICKNCPSYSGRMGMFCSRSNNQKLEKKEGCICESCELFRKFRLEGDYFCQKGEKSEFIEESNNFRNEYIENSMNCNSTNDRNTRICILEKLEYLDE